MSELEQVVRDFIRTTFVMGRPDVALGPDDSFMDLGLVDSTGVLELTGFLEERFGFQIADSEMVPENLDTISNIVRYVMRKVKSAAESIGAGGAA